MKHALIYGLAAALVCSLPAVAKDGPFKAPRTGYGPPDLGGTWSNAGP